MKCIFSSACLLQVPLMRWMDHYLQGPGGEPPPCELDHAARLEAAAEEP
jgi:hypothetical protein